MQLCNYDFIICHPGYHDAVPFAYIKTTSHQALKTRHRCLLGYNHRKFSFGGTSGSTREKPVLVVQLTAWPWILSKQPVSSTIQLHMQKVSDGVAHCVDFKSTWQRPATKKRESAALALMNIHCITQIGFSKTIDTVVHRHPWCLLLTNILTE